MGAIFSGHLCLPCTYLFSSYSILSHSCTRFACAPSRFNFVPGGYVLPRLYMSIP